MHTPRGGCGSVTHSRPTKPGSQDRSKVNINQYSPPVMTAKDTKVTKMAKATTAAKAVKAAEASIAAKEKAENKIKTAKVTPAKRMQRVPVAGRAKCCRTPKPRYDCASTGTQEGRTQKKRVENPEVDDEGSHGHGQKEEGRENKKSSNQEKINSPNQSTPMLHKLKAGRFATEDKGKQIKKKQIKDTGQDSGLSLWQKIKLPNQHEAQSVVARKLFAEMALSDKSVSTVSQEPMQGSIHDDIQSYVLTDSEYVPFPAIRL